MSKKRLELTWYNKDKALIPTEHGKYSYRWVEPNDPRYAEVHALIYDEYVKGRQSEKSEDFSYSERAELQPQDDNLLILGESGNVLDTLNRVPELADKYRGNVKLVYVDPPFNTSQTFASYEDNLEHSIWLTMMRDRLQKLKQLLADDGSIWVHLDMVENHRMRLLLDEVFEGHFITEIAWQKADSPRNDADFFSSDHDIILVYAKNSSFKVNGTARTAADNARFSNPDNDPKGAWWDDNPSAPGARTHQGMVYAIQQPITGELIYPARGRCWSFGQEDILDFMNGWALYKLEILEDAEKRAELCGVPVEEVRQDVAAIVLDMPLEEAREQAQKVYDRGNWPTYILRSGGTGGFGRKSYIPTRLNVPRTWWANEEVGHNRTAKSEIKALFANENPFSTPKPEKLLERIIHIATKPGDIVLDCFAGSGTTAAVAQKMGRRWVTCELLEFNFNHYTRPRLEMVVNDKDYGGITRSKGERVPADGVELPEGVSPDDAALFTKVLNKLVAEDVELKKNATVKAIKKMAKTKRTKDVINWRGGGGFQVAHLDLPCYDYDEEYKQVIIKCAHDEKRLARSVAANLGFYMLEEGSAFTAWRGKTCLKVVAGTANKELVDALVERLPQGMRLMLAAVSIPDGVRQYARKRSKGSKLLVIADDLFCVARGGRF